MVDRFSLNCPLIYTGDISGVYVSPYFTRRKPFRNVISLSVLLLPLFHEVIFAQCGAILKKLSASLLFLVRLALMNPAMSPRQPTSPIYRNKRSHTMSKIVHSLTRLDLTLSRYRDQDTFVQKVASWLLTGEIGAFVSHIHNTRIRF